MKIVQGPTHSKEMVDELVAVCVCVCGGGGGGGGGEELVGAHSPEPCYSSLVSRISRPFI